MSIILSNPIRPTNYYQLYNYDLKYLNVNKDSRLRKDVTSFFLKKLIKWIKNDSEFKKYNNLLKTLDTINGTKLVYKLLRTYVNKHKVNWYDLRTEKYYLIKDYFNRKL